MRFLKNSLAVFALVLIFAVSFAAGRMTAVRSGERQAEKAVEEAERAVAILPLLRAAEGAASENEAETEQPLPEESRPVMSAAPGQEVEEEKDEPPCPIPSPVQGQVSNPYSLQAVYSQTMRDWRAHTGMDIEAPLTAAVTVPADGTVTRVYTDRLWGNVIEIRHKGGLKTVYKGVSTLDMVKVGENVTAGDVISGVGTSPAECKAMPHLHFETWLDGVCVNPECYVVG